MPALASAREDHRTEVVRWGAAFAAVLSLYAGLGALLLTRERTVTGDAPPPAVMVDLAPVSAAPSGEPSGAPDQAELMIPVPPPEQVARPEPEASAEPEQAEVVPLQAPPAPIPMPLPKPVVVPRSTAIARPASAAIPKPLPKTVPPQPKPVVKREPELKAKAKPEKPEAKREAKPPAPVRVAGRPAPVAAPGRSAPRVGAATRTASIAGQAAGQPSPSLPGWHALVRARLQGLQRYPAEAQATGASGTTTVAFVVDRGGRVLSARVAGSSGSALLDQASVGMVRSASLPPPPGDVPGATFPFSIPLRYRPR